MQQCVARVTLSIIISSIEKGHHFPDTKFAVFIPRCETFLFPAVSIFSKCSIGNLQKDRLAEQGEAGLPGLGVGTKLRG